MPKVNSLPIRIALVISKENGSSFVKLWRTEYGCWPAVSYLEKEFGIMTVPSTVYNGKKSFTAVKYGYFKTKKELLGYVYWTTNRLVNDKSEFYSDCKFKQHYENSNPFKDFHIRAMPSIHFDNSFDEI